MMDEHDEASALGTDPDPFDDLPWRVLLAVPDVRHVPAFAFVAPAARQDYRVEELDKAVAEQVSFAWRVNTIGEPRPPHAFINIRRRKGQSAVYSSWLSFRSLDHAREFATRDRRWGRDTLTARTRADFDQANGRLTRNVADGVFDLGRLAEERRLGTAKRYVERHEEVDRLREELARLELLGADPFQGRVGTSVG